LDASYQTLVSKLTAEGIIDPTRVGIAGHSFSANAVTYAISHTNLFRAAVIGSGPTIDPGTYSLVAPAGDSWRKAVYRVIGLPKPSNDPEHIWEAVSPALNARSVTAALLIQTPESEYLFNLQQYAYLQDAHKDVDMYVYPGEGHMASGRPIHQYWRNKRSVDWFVKWLTASPAGG
jgi:dipeptidyl aminopeptidase/acylaminoacyl peptidase